MSLLDKLLDGVDRVDLQQALQLGQVQADVLVTKVNSHVDGDVVVERLVHLVVITGHSGVHLLMCRRRSPCRSYWREGLDSLREEAQHVGVPHRSNLRRLQGSFSGKTTFAAQGNFFLRNAVTGRSDGRTCARTVDTPCSCLPEVTISFAACVRVQQHKSGGFTLLEANPYWCVEPPLGNPSFHHHLKDFIPPPTTPPPTTTSRTSSLHPPPLHPPPPQGLHPSTHHHLKDSTRATTLQPPSRLQKTTLFQQRRINQK